MKEAKLEIVEICLTIRKFLRNNPHLDLRHVIDSIREVTTELWHNFDDVNKRKFLRLLPYWNIFRHRAPIESIEIIENMISSGQIKIEKGTIKDVIKNDDKIIVKTSSKDIAADYLINCLGFEFNAKKYPLLANMIEHDLVKQDLFLIKSNDPKIHLLGGLNIATDFETTAVPDLRRSVEQVVSKV